MTIEDLNLFHSKPWCSALLDDPEYTIMSTVSREPKLSTEDAFFAETLKTDRTISACISQYKTPTSDDGPIETVRALISLNSGLNGYPHVAHGGLIATLLDEMMGLLLTINKDREQDIANTQGRKVERVSNMTAELVVTYLKPVNTPQTVVVFATLGKQDGRKLWLNGSINDKSGEILAKATSLFIRRRSEKL